MDSSTRATELTDLDELGSFLVEGFHAPPGSAFARAETLRWKYFDPQGGADPPQPRSWLRRSEGRIVAHVGLSLTEFQVVGAGAVREGPRTLHMMDWLADPAYPSAGARLMLLAERGVPTQYGLGGSAAGRSVIAGHGYELIGSVPLFALITRPASWLRAREGDFAGRLARCGRDAVRLWTSGLGRSVGRVRWRPVSSFAESDPDAIGPEQLLARFPEPVLTTRRDAALLDHLLRCPAANAEITGGYLEIDGDRRGFALLSRLTRGRLRIGKLVECWLDTPDTGLLRDAIRLLVGQLRQENVDLIEAYGGSRWRDEALRLAGFRLVDHLDLRVRDRDRLLARELPIHLSPIEADYAFS